MYLVLEDSHFISYSQNSHEKQNTNKILDLKTLDSTSDTGTHTVAGLHWNKTSLWRPAPWWYEYISNIRVPPKTKRHDGGWSWRQVHLGRNTKGLPITSPSHLGYRSWPFLLPSRRIRQEVIPSKTTCHSLLWTSNLLRTFQKVHRHGWIRKWTLTFTWFFVVKDTGVIFYKSQCQDFFAFFYKFSLFPLYLHLTTL